MNEAEWLSSTDPRAMLGYLLYGVRGTSVAAYIRQASTLQLEQDETTDPELREKEE